VRTRKFEVTTNEAQRNARWGQQLAPCRCASQCRRSSRLENQAAVTVGNCGVTSASAALPRRRSGGRRQPPRQSVGPRATDSEQTTASASLEEMIRNMGSDVTGRLALGRGETCRLRAPSRRRSVEEKAVVEQVVETPRPVSSFVTIGVARNGQRQKHRRIQTPPVDSDGHGVYHFRGIKSVTRRRNIGADEHETHHESNLRSLAEAVPTGGHKSYAIVGLCLSLVILPSQASGTRQGRSPLAERALIEPIHAENRGAPFTVRTDRSFTDIVVGNSDVWRMCVSRFTDSSVYVQAKNNTGATNVVVLRFLKAIIGRRLILNVRDRFSTISNRRSTVPSPCQCVGRQYQNGGCVFRAKFRDGPSLCKGARNWPDSLADNLY